MDEVLDDVIVEDEALELGDELSEEEKVEIAENATPLDEVSDEEIV